MQEFFYTVLGIWLIWKIFGMFSNSRPKQTTQQFNQTNHHHNHYHSQADGEVKIQPNPGNRKPSSNDEEYADYEEIK